MRSRFSAGRKSAVLCTNEIKRAIVLAFRLEIRENAKEKLVEAGGIEPPSASPTQPATTCLVRRLCLTQKRPKNEAKSAPAVYF